MPQRLIRVLAAVCATLCCAGAWAAAPVLEDVLVVPDYADRIIQLRFRNPAAHGVVTLATDVTVELEGDVSNSSVPGHARPVASKLAFSPSSADSPLFARAFLAATDVNSDCSEELLGVLQDDAAGLVDFPSADLLRADRVAGVSTSPGGSFSLRLRLRHRHVGWDDYHALLGVRRLRVTIGGATYERTLAIGDDDPRNRRPVAIVDDERKLSRAFYYSPPDALFLASETDGSSHRSIFIETSIRGGSLVRVAFRCYFARGNDRNLKVDVSPGAYLDRRWKPGEGFEFKIDPRQERWRAVEKIVRLKPDENLVRLRFLLTADDASVTEGLVYIDDVVVEPVDPISRATP